MAEVKLEPDDAYVVSVLESMRDSPEAFSRQAIKGIADRLLAAWNRRSGGWRPIDDEAKKLALLPVYGKHADEPDEGPYVSWAEWSEVQGEWLDLAGYYFEPTMYYVITPPEEKSNA